MSRKNINAGIWLIGLGILFLFNFFWPGILILVGITMLVNALVPDKPQEIPPAAPASVIVEATAEPVKSEEKTAEMNSEEEPLPPILAEEGDRLYKSSILPETCVMCGGPVKANAHQVTWKDGNTAICPFCNALLPVKPVE